MKKCIYIQIWRFYKMVKITQKQLENKLISFGLNKDRAKQYAKKHLSYLNRVYPSDSLKTKANIAMSLGL